MALSGPSWLVFLFSHLAVRLSQSRSTGAMTVWHPIIPLGLIVLLHAPCSSFKLITKSKMHSEHSVPCVVFLREDRGRERRQKWISVFGRGQSITKIFSLFSASLVPKRAQRVTLSLRLGSLSKVQVKSIWKHPQSQTTIHTHVQTNSWFRPLTESASLPWIALSFVSQIQK